MRRKRRRRIKMKRMMWTCMQCNFQQYYYHFRYVIVSFGFFFFVCVLFQVSFSFSFSQKNVHQLTRKKKWYETNALIYFGFRLKPTRIEQEQQNVYVVCCLLCYIFVLTCFSEWQSIAPKIETRFFLWIAAVVIIIVVVFFFFSLRFCFSVEAAIVSQYICGLENILFALCLSGSLVLFAIKM